MATHIGPNAPGEGKDPNFKVRTGRASKRSGPRQQTVRGMLARMRGRSGSGRKDEGRAKRHGGSKGRGTMPFNSFGARGQRVVVKALSKYHAPRRGGAPRPGTGHTSSGLAKHVTYLQREGTGIEGERAQFYSAEQERIDVTHAQEQTRQWEQDPYHFRIIISPENANDIADLRQYVRDVMQRVEQDVGTQIEWMAINHHNTDNPHAHVLVRGKDQRGQELFIRSEYLAHGFRGRASEAATELLGERTEKEIERGKEKEVTASRFTSLDRIIERGTEDGRFDISPHKRIGFRTTDRPRVLARLQQLQRMGLAEPQDGATWQIDQNFKRTLMQIGMRNDIIAQLYSSLGQRAAQVDASPLTQPFAGVVVAKGRVDEVSDWRYLVVQDQAGKMRYGRVRDGRDYRSLQKGDAVQLGQRTYQRDQIAQRVLQASGPDGRYTPSQHLQMELARHPGKPAEVAQWVQAVERQVSSWAALPGTGIERGEQDRMYRVDRRQFQQFTQRQASRGATDVRNLSELARERSRGRGMGLGN